MKKLIATVFALAVAAPLLGVTAAQALTIGIHTGPSHHYVRHHYVRHHRHQVCSWHHHHRSCYWR